MSEVYPVADTGRDLADLLTFEQREVLERAVVKIVLLGAQVGSTEQMILLLKSGLTVGELVEYLAVRNGEKE